MKRVMGIAIGWRGAVLACVTVKRGTATVVSQASVARDRKTVIEATLEELLKHVPPAFQNTGVSLALSSGELACADCFELPFRSARELELIVASLAEGRAAGESADDLAIDFCQLSATKNGSRVQVQAISHVLLDRLREVFRQKLPAARLERVTAIPEAVAQGLANKKGVHAIHFTTLAEAVIVKYAPSGEVEAWRSLPTENTDVHSRLLAGARELDPACEPLVKYDSQATLELGGCVVPVDVSPAVCAALLIDHKSVNLLRGRRDAPRSWVGKLRRPVMAFCASAALFLLCAGVYFEKQADAERQALSEYESAERKLWQTVTAEKYRPGMLHSKLKKTLSEYNAAEQERRRPSALRFWGEMASVMPDPNQIGMSLESLYINPEGGRLIGKVSRGISDPLSNAALLERSLNKSDMLAARSEFETRETEIVVRMQLDYQSALREEYRK